MLHVKLCFRSNYLLQKNQNHSMTSHQSPIIDYNYKFDKDICITSREKLLKQSQLTIKHHPKISTTPCAKFCNKKCLLHLACTLISSRWSAFSYLQNNPDVNNIFFILTLIHVKTSEAFSFLMILIWTGSCVTCVFLQWE